MWGAYALALLCVRAVPRKAAVVVVLGLAVVLRLAAVSHKAPLSDDLYRYAWDGVVQSSGTDPYRYPPDAQQLRGLRDPWLWPPDQADRPRKTLLNRPGVRTIYPPVAEGWFWLEHQVVPLSARDEGYQLAGLVLDAGVVAALLALLRRAGRDPRWVAVYALAPLAVLEAVQNAHVDVLAVLLVLGAVAAGARKPVLSAAALAGAALVKIYPGLLLVLLLRRPGRPLAVRRVLQVGTVAAGLAVLAYLPHVLAVGPQVVGYLPGYLREEQYGNGTRYLLVSLLGLSGGPATAAVGLALTALVVHLLRTPLSLPGAAVRLLVGVLLLATPVQPWYALLLLALVVLSGDWWAVPLAAAAYPLFFATILDGPAVPVGRLSYGVAGLAALSAAVAARRRSVAAGRPVGAARPAR